MASYYQNFEDASKQSLANEDTTEFSDTFSESGSSSIYFSSDRKDSLENELDPVDYASSRLEKYFLNLLPTSKSTEDCQKSSDSDENSNHGAAQCKQKVKRRKKGKKSSESTSNDSSEESIPAFMGPDQFDTIKKMSSKITSKSDLEQKPEEQSEPVISGENNSKSVQRSNSFLQWSSDEEVNIMMYKLKHLIKDLHSEKKEPPTPEDEEQLTYLENELVRLMKIENKSTSNTSGSESDREILRSLATENERLQGPTNVEGKKCFSNQNYVKSDKILIFK